MANTFILTSLYHKGNSTASSTTRLPISQRPFSYSFTTQSYKIMSTTPDITETTLNCFRDLGLNMLATAEYSDLTLKCQGQSFKVHRVVVCPQSKPLTACLKEGWKVHRRCPVQYEIDSANQEIRDSRQARSSWIMSRTLLRFWLISSIRRRLTCLLVLRKVLRKVPREKLLTRRYWFLQRYIIVSLEESWTLAHIFRSMLLPINTAYLP